MEKDSQITQIINDQPKICIIVLGKKIIVLYTIVSIGVGGHFSLFYFVFKIGLKDRDFQDKIELLNPELSSNPAELFLMYSCSGEHYNPPSYSLSLSLSTLRAIAIYSPGQQKEIIYSGPIRDIELIFLG